MSGLSRLLSLFSGGTAARPRTDLLLPPENIDFFSTEGPAHTLPLVRDFAANAKAQRVFVIGGLTYLFRDLSAADFPGFEVLINKNDTFIWLLQACEYLKTSKIPAVLVSKMPRSWKMLTITFQVYDWERRMLYEPYHKAGGTIETASAPSGLTLEATPSGMDVAFCFVHMAASSYYAEIMQSQGCPTKNPTLCHALIDLKSEADIDTSLIASVRAAKTLEEKQTLLCRFAGEEEHRCRTLEHGTLRRTFTGGFLFPGANAKDVLPEGAPTVEQLVARKERDTGAPPGSEDLVSLVREAEWWWNGLVDKAVSLRDYPQYARIRELGESIHALGGFEAMQKASLHVRNACPTFGYTVDHMWKGIGGWIP